MSLDTKVSTVDSLVSLEAQIESLRGQKEQALQRLAGRTDPTSVRRRIGILIESQKFPEAVAEFRSLDISESWVDLGAFALAFTGEHTEAKKFLAWARAHKNPNLAQRTAALLVDGMMQKAFKNRPDGAHLVPGTLSEQEKQVLVEIVEAIEPLCNFALSRGSVETEVESQVLQKYFDVLFLLGERAKASTAFDVLLTRTPIPIRLGQAVLQGFGSASVNLVKRLWEEHPGSFRARFFSCVILGRQLSDSKKASERAFSLEGIAKSKEQREELCELIYELALGEGEDDAFQRVEEFTNKLLGRRSYLLELFRADQLTRAGKYQDALAVLESIRSDNDPRWLRGYANAKIQVGERAEALELLKRLGMTVPNPEVFRVIVKLSGEQGLIDDERAALEQTLALEPEHIDARRRLAMLLADAKEYLEAAKHFEVLRAAQPDDEAVIVNLAVSYCFAGDLDRALSVLAPAPGETSLPYGLLKTRSQVLWSTGRVSEAFDELAKAKSEHWEEPEYLVRYMELAYSAGKEKEAHEAVTKLQELHQKGVVDEKLMRPVSLEEMRKWIEGVAKRHDEIRRYLLQGKMTWLAAAEMQREVPLWSWLLKTQPLSWVWDEPLNRATYSIYATNGFRVLQHRSLPSTFESISCAPKGTSVAVDLSALITLHELGLLNRAADYFGTLYVPTAYLSKVADDARKLLPHQISQKQAAQDIESAVSGGRIAVLATATSSGAGQLLIDEYTDEPVGGSTRLRLRDLFDVMHTSGVLSDDQLAQTKLAAHKLAASAEDQKILNIGSRLAIGEATLVTLHGLGLMDVVTREFSVHITKSDFEEVAARLRAFNALEKARNKYTGLWSTLRKDQRFCFTAVRSELKLEANKNREDRELSFSGMLMAKERNLPFLSDDRVSQTVVLNERKEDKIAAFGVDSVIAALLEAGEIEAHEAARLLLRLMEWRYRFILMSPEAMKALADQYRVHPPGTDMRQVARYVHDCMRDPGLFGGLEPTTPPVSIAVRLYQSWAQNIAELVMDIWMDTEISESYAEEFTAWAMTELLPSPPRVLDERMQATISSLTPLTVITRALIRASDSNNYERINRGLRSMATALGLEEAEYIEIVVRVARGADD